jgi:hypothetical protein
MADFNASYDVFSPRWGHADRYEVTLTVKGMTIRQGTNAAECKIDDTDDHIWSGYNEQLGNPLINIFNNDSIHAPPIVALALEHAWDKWRNGVDEAEIRAGLQELFSWIDLISTNKPRGELWRGAF